jgi:mono/diheme cytochrome c family protein
LISSLGVRDSRDSYFREPSCGCKDPGTGIFCRVMRASLALLFLLAVGPALAAPAQPDGRALYVEQCARCHGGDRGGDGADAAFFSPPPRDLGTGFLAVHSDEALLARLREGEPLSLAQDAEGRAARSRTVEVLVAHLRELPDLDWKQIDAGGLIYGARCEVCHGPFGKPWPGADLPPGVQRMPRDLRSPAFQASVNDAQLLEAIEHGRAGMPALVPRLGDTESAQVLAFVRLLSPGFETYSFYCAGCHGDDGRGRGIMLGEGRRPDIIFDRAFFGETDPEELRMRVWHMMDAGGGGMPHFDKSLTDAQLKAIFAYLRSAS